MTISLFWYLVALCGAMASMTPPMILKTLKFAFLRERDASAEDLAITTPDGSISFSISVAMVAQELLDVCFCTYATSQLVNV